MRFRDYFPAALMIILSCVVLYFLVPAYTRYKQTRRTVTELQESLEAQELEIQRLRQELVALRTDYRAIERVAREKFGLCREGEKIYHFDAPPGPAPEQRSESPGTPGP